MTSHTISLEVTCARDDYEKTGDVYYGPGRTIGRVLDYLGFKMDKGISDTAERLGYGPRVTARRIFLRSGYELDAEREKRQKKDVDRLLNYVNSNVPLTRRQALESLVDIATTDSNLRSYLKLKGATKLISDAMEIHSKFRWSGQDDLLLSSSRKALVCLSDTPVMKLFQPLLGQMVLDTHPFPSVWKRVSIYLNDPNTAFLVVRLLRSTSCITKEVMEAIMQAPEYFEWEECRKIVFSCILDLPIPSSGEISALATSLFSWILRNAKKMPNLFREWPFETLNLNYQGPGLTDYRFAKAHLVRHVAIHCIASELNRTAPVTSLDLLKRTYDCPLLQPFLEEITCPVVYASIQIVNADPEFYDHTPTSYERQLYDEMVRNIKSEDSRRRSRAWNFVNYFACRDIHRHNMMLEALGKIGLRLPCVEIQGLMSRFKLFIPSRPQDAPHHCPSIYRHDSIDGTHVTRFGGLPGCGCPIFSSVEVLLAPKWTLHMRVRPSEVFSSEGYETIIAGYDKFDGAPLHIAELYFPLFECQICQRHLSKLTFPSIKNGDFRLSSPLSFQSIIITIKNGTRLDDIDVELECAHKRERKEPFYLEVPVMRYGRNDCANIRYNKYEGALFSWRPEGVLHVPGRHHERIVKRPGGYSLQIGNHHLELEGGGPSRISTTLGGEGPESRGHCTVTQPANDGEECSMNETDWNKAHYPQPDASSPLLDGSKADINIIEVAKGEEGSSKGSNTGPFDCDSRPGSLVKVASEHESRSIFEHELDYQVSSTLDAHDMGIYISASQLILSSILKYSLAILLGYMLHAFLV